MKRVYAAHHRGRGRWRNGRTAAPREALAAEAVALESARPGDRFQISEISDERARMTALRFGVAEGAQVDCTVRIPAGPIIVRSGRQEIAIGRGLARRILVQYLSNEDQ